MVMDRLTVKQVVMVTAGLVFIGLLGLLSLNTKTEVAGDAIQFDGARENEAYHHRAKRSVAQQMTQDGNVGAQCYEPDPSARFDCYPGLFATQEKCEARGCCWIPPSKSKVGRPLDVPYCFYPVDYPSYTLGQLSPMPWGYQADFTLTSTPAWPPQVISELQLHIILQSQNTLRIKIVDPKNARYEVPIPVPHVSKGVNVTDYAFHVNDSPFAIKVWRKSTGAMLFDSDITGAPLIYADQFLQMSTRVSSGFVYGLGEHQGPLLHNLSAGWNQISLWALDQPPQENTNLYGSHPFYMSLTEDGDAYGVFLLNSNAMDVDLQPLPALTFRPIGGILDFYIFSGPTPDAVVQQYTKVIGQPYLPPYWSLGFHLCRYGYTGTQEMHDVLDRNRKAGFPYDVQWTDIDYMDSYLDWTYDTDKFNGLPDLVDDLHKNGQRYVIIVDPGISISRPGHYPAYDDGLKQDVFIKNATGQHLIGKVWPGLTTYPDFSHPNSAAWWTKCAADFHKQVPFDGLWTDMNEPSSFIYGSTDGCTDSLLDNPPYTPGILGDSLPMKTICPSARHYGGRHYNLHNLFGHMEVNATRSALDAIHSGKRTLIITRSSFPGTGQFGGKWTGDNKSLWLHLYYSIPGILNFQMFGIPFIGADICGFGLDTTEELCTRWMQLGAFYPFMRNHNSIGSSDQDPAVWSADAQARIKAALELRYSLLPLLYTLLYQSHMNGTAVARPLFFESPSDPEVYSLDRQFMWGDTLLISPVLDEGATKLKLYYPSGTWYDYYTGQKVAHSGEWATLDVTLDTLPVNVRMMKVVVTQTAAVTTTKARYNPFQLTVALCPMNRASGALFWDDGESSGEVHHRWCHFDYGCNIQHPVRIISLMNCGVKVRKHACGRYKYIPDSITSGKHNYITFNVAEGVMTSQVLSAGFKAENNMTVDHIRVLGVSSKPNSVTLNGKGISFTYATDTQVLVMDSFPVFSLMKPMQLVWK